MYLYNWKRQIKVEQMQVANKVKYKQIKLT